MSMGGQMLKEACRVNPDSPLCSWAKPFERFIDDTIGERLFALLLFLPLTVLIIYTLVSNFIKKRRDKK